MRFYVDPSNVTKYDRTEAELELFFLFCTVVAGKTATTQARLLEQFLLKLPKVESNRPFDMIGKIGRHSQAFADLLMESRLGQYNRLRQCWIEAHSFLYGSLSQCSLADLEAIHGVGPKTARFFLLHTRRDQNLAVLDTHILKFLRDQGFANVPTGTPGSGPLYERWEKQFIALAKESGKTVADFDLSVWRQYSGN